MFIFAHHKKSITKLEQMQKNTNKMTCGLTKLEVGKDHRVDVKEVCNNINSVEKVD